MRRALILVPVLLAGLVVAACGTGEDSGLTEIDVAEAASRTVEAGSARLALEGSDGDEGDFAGEGEFAGDRGRLSMRFEGAQGGVVPEELELVFDGATLYVGLAGLGALVPGELAGKEWLKIDLGEGGPDAADFLSLVRGDPSRILRDLEAAGDFEEVGTEEVRGAPTTHYRGTVHSAQTNVWIGEDGLVRRVDIAEEDDGSMMTMELYDFGADVEVEPPPADAVVDMSELFQGGF